MNTQNTKNYSEIRNRICIRALPLNCENSSSLYRVPYLDMAIGLFILNSDTTDSYSPDHCTDVTAQMVIDWDVSHMQLYDDAIENTKRLFPFRFTYPFDGSFQWPMKVPELMKEMVFVVNEQLSNAIASLLFTDCLETAADLMAGDLMFIAPRDSMTPIFPVRADSYMEIYDILSRSSLEFESEGNAVSHTVWYYDRNEERIYAAEERLPKLKQKKVQ